jgi:hypothetical protein
MLIAVQRNVGCPELAEADPNAVEVGAPLCGTGGVYTAHYHKEPRAMLANKSYCSAWKHNYAFYCLREMSKVRQTLPILHSVQVLGTENIPPQPAGDEVCFQQDTLNMRSMFDDFCDKCTCSLLVA